MCFRPLAGCGLFHQGASCATGHQGFPSPCGVWVVSSGPIVAKMESWFPSPCGVWVVSEMADYPTAVLEFPSPCGVWVVSELHLQDRREQRVSVPLRGVGCFPKLQSSGGDTIVSVPLRGVGCFPTRPERYEDRAFPSPCGVWVVSEKYGYTESDSGFPSPCGVWVVSIGGCMTKLSILVSVPLRGVGCFQQNRSDEKWANGFRPLAGCGLFL